MQQFKNAQTKKPPHPWGGRLSGFLSLWLTNFNAAKITHAIISDINLSLCANHLRNGALATSDYFSSLSLRFKIAKLRQRDLFHKSPRSEAKNISISVIKVNSIAGLFSLALLINIAE